MMRKQPHSHNEAIREVVAEYEKGGYHINIQPPPSALPSFLRGFEPDILASSEKENVVIEVKFGESLDDERIAKIAEAIDKQKGWRFELVSFSKGHRPSAMEFGSPISKEELVDQIKSARHLLTLNQLAGGLVLAWSALEGILLNVARSRDISFKSHQVGYLIRQAYASGLIGWRDYNVLLKVSNLRNRAAHGLSVKADLRKPTTAVLRIAEKLVKYYLNQSSYMTERAVSGKALRRRVSRRRD